MTYDFNVQPRDVMSFSPAYLDVVYEYRLEDIAYRYSDLGVSGFYNFTPCGETALSPYTYSSHWGNIGHGDVLHVGFEAQADGAPGRHGFGQRQGLAVARRYGPWPLHRHSQRLRPPAADTRIIL